MKYSSTFSKISTYKLSVKEAPERKVNFLKNIELTQLTNYEKLKEKDR